MVNDMRVRRRIAVLCGQPDEEFQSRFIEGVLEQAFADDLDVCIFAMYQKFQENELREIGESNIFNLVNFDKFDAILVMADTIQTPGVLQHIEHRLADGYKGTVLFVDKTSNFFPSIILEHYEPIRRITEHLINDHGFQDIAFLAGKEWHFHSRERLKAFTDTMAEHGLEVKDGRIFYGDFWFDGGANFVDELMKNPDDLPEAIACANDYMAIGVASALTKYGIRVPEDIAVTGYDSNIDGRESPKPITSFEVPAKEYGRYAYNTIADLLQGRRISPFKPVSDLFIGGSCGCRCESMIPKVTLRHSWATEESKRSMYSSYNRVLDDMLTRDDFRGIMDTIQTYTFKLRPFDSFNICMNSNWADGGTPGSIKRGYSEQMLNVLSCGPEGKGADKLQFDTLYNAEDILPSLDEPSAYPKAHWFFPLNFDDNGFGFAEIGFGDEIRCVDDLIFLWLRNIIFGLECIRRQIAIRVRDEAMENQQITDDLTGLYNYKGFVKHSKPMIEHARLKDQYIGVLAVDVSDLGSINQRFGRKEGDNAIIAVAKMLTESAGEGGLCCRLGNDEFVVARITKENNNKDIYDIRHRLYRLLEEFNRESKYHIKLISGGKVERLNIQGDMERLVNAAVTLKNGNKKREQRMHFTSHLSPEEQQQADIVGRLLDENRFNYHFQPIVDARTGEIFAYEALMRPDHDPYIGPQTIIEYAEILGRMVDVERATFFNVLNAIDNNREVFGGRKVFINSIPGVKIRGSEGRSLNERLRHYSDLVVIELTENTEADDNTIVEMKTNFRQLGIQSAIDDYGTGYSNIVNLLKYMPDYIKIDRMLISGIENNPQKQHFFKEIANFAHDNNFKILSEGVETSAELRTSIELGADYIQGYYTGRPKATVVREIEPMIREEIFRYNARFFGDWT